MDKELSETRKADRLKMADKLAGVLTEYAGVSATIIDYANHVYPDGSRSSRTKCVAVEITAPGGAYINVRFDGETSQPNVHVATWNTPSVVWLNPGWFISCNPHHYGKCNVVAHGIVDLIEQLRVDVIALINGEGYMTLDDPRVQAMKARYLEQGWNWDHG